MALSISSSVTTAFCVAWHGWQSGIVHEHHRCSAMFGVAAIFSNHPPETPARKPEPLKPTMPNCEIAVGSWRQLAVVCPPVPGLVSWLTDMEEQPCLGLYLALAGDFDLNAISTKSAVQHHVTMWGSMLHAVLAHCRRKSLVAAPAVSR